MHLQNIYVVFIYQGHLVEFKVVGTNRSNKPN